MIGWLANGLHPSPKKRVLPQNSWSVCEFSGTPILCKVALVGSTRIETFWQLVKDWNLVFYRRCELQASVLVRKSSVCCLNSVLSGVSPAYRLNIYCCAFLTGEFVFRLRHFSCWPPLSLATFLRRLWNRNSCRTPSNWNCRLALLAVTALVSALTRLPTHIEFALENVAEKKKKKDMQTHTHTRTQTDTHKKAETLGRATCVHAGCVWHLARQKWTLWEHVFHRNNAPLISCSHSAACASTHWRDPGPPCGSWRSVKWTGTAKLSAGVK